MDDDKAPALASEDEARDRLGAKAFDEAVMDGSLRRVRDAAGDYFYVGADVDKAARLQDPAFLARVARGEVDEDGDDGPGALARSMPRL